MDMEIGDMSHLGPDIVVQMLMLYATSPLARESYEKLMTGNPFNIDIKLDDTSSNRSAEIVETCLKTIGKRIQFRKVKKEIAPSIEFHPIRYYDKGYYSPIVFWDKELGSESIAPFVKLRDEMKDTVFPILFHPIMYNIPFDEALEKMNENERNRLMKLAEDIANGVIDFER